MDPTKLTLEAIIGFGIGFGLGNNPVERQVIDLEIQKYLALAKKEQSDQTREIVKKVDDFKRELRPFSWEACFVTSGLYGLVNAIAAQSATKGISGYLTALPAALLGNATAKTINRYKDRKKYQDLKIIKEIISGDRSVESLLTPMQVNSMIQLGAQLEESIMSDEKPFKYAFNESCRLTLEGFTKNPREYLPLVLDWAGKHITERVDKFVLQKRLKDFYNTPSDYQGIDCGYFGTKGNTKLKLYAREAEQLNIGTIEWKNVKPIRVNGKCKGLEFSQPQIEIEESTPWTADYRDLAERVAVDKNKGIILYHSKSIALDITKKAAINRVFSEVYEGYINKR